MVINFSIPGPFLEKVQFLFQWGVLFFFFELGRLCTANLIPVEVSKNNDLVEKDKLLKNLFFLWEMHYTRDKKNF